MGNVIRGEFGTSHKKENITDPDRIEAEHFDLMTRLIESGAVGRLFNLRYTYATFCDAQEKVKEYTLQQLVGMIEEHDESDWAQDPAFYRAVFKEMKSRLDRELAKNNNQLK